jgi:hypothetical protein
MLYGKLHDPFDELFVYRIEHKRKDSAAVAAASAARHDDEDDLLYYQDEQGETTANGKR